MSRIAKNPIPIPPKTEVSKLGRVLLVKGPLGELSRDFRDEVKISIETGESGGKEVVLTPSNSEIFTRALSGTYASHIKNMIAGVNTPYRKKLIVEGVGYRVAHAGDMLTLSIGFSHPVNLKIPRELTVAVEKNTVSISGIDKERVGAFSAFVRAKKKPEPYKGKGIRYENETVRRKQGKKTA